MLKRFHLPFEVLIAAVVIACNIFVVFAPENSVMSWFTTDDAFYYFKTAQNVTQGLGVTFDGIGRSSGFHPLWMAVCIPVFALTRINLFLPLRVLVGISILLAAGSGILIFRLLKRFLSPQVAALMALFWVMNPDVHYITTQLGMEAGINAFFSIFLIYSVSQYELACAGRDGSARDILKVGGVAILALLSRLDNIFLVLLVGVWLVLRRSNVRYLLLADWILAACSVFCSFFLRLGFQEAYGQYILAAEIMLAANLVVKTIAFYLFGLYGQERVTGWLGQALRITAAVIVSTIITGVLILALQATGILPGFPRTTLFIDWAFSMVAVFAVRVLYHLISGAPGLLPAAAPENRVMQSLKRWMLDAAPYFVPLGIVLAVYMTWNHFYFGTSMPVSGQIKHWWGTLFTVYGRPVDSFTKFFGLTDNLNGGTWGLLFYFQNNAAELVAKLANIHHKNVTQNMAYGFGSLFTLLSLFLVAINWKHLLKSFAKLSLFPLLVANFAQVFYYNGTNYVNMRPWYWVTQFFLITMLFALVAEAAILSLKRCKVSETTLQIGTAVLSILLIAGLVSMLVDLVPWKINPKKEKSYLGGMQAVEQFTEPGSLIGSTGGGVIAYFIQGRTIVNLDGLMNSNEYFQLEKKQEGYLYLNKIGLNYVYGNKYMITDSEPYMASFKDRVNEIGFVGGTTLFKYIIIPK